MSSQQRYWLTARGGVGARSSAVVVQVLTAAAARRCIFNRWLRVWAIDRSVARGDSKDESGDQRS